MDETIFKNKVIRSLILRYLDGKIDKIIPVSDPKVGVRYPLIEWLLASDGSLTDEGQQMIQNLISAKAIKVSYKDVMRILETLRENGILEREHHGSVLACPKCGSSSLLWRPLCPNCGSDNIIRSMILEHLKCGAIAREEAFKKDSTLECFRCYDKLNVNDESLKKLGYICTCQDCKKDFDNPIFECLCQDCNERFKPIEGDLTKLWSYTFHDEVIPQVSISLYAEALREALEPIGLKVKAPLEVEGRSKIKYTFQAGCFKGEDSKPLVVVDLVRLKPELSAKQVLEFITKCIDIEVEWKILVVIPSLEEKEKELLDIQGVAYVEGENLDAALEHLKRKVKQKIKGE
ncbi:MAG: hypothetical protein ACTSVF_04140 [Candidatus Asgardarchaeia archaeon]